MISWLSTLPLFSRIYRQGGIDSFALAQKDILETMQDDLEKRADILAQEKVAKLLSNVDLGHIVKYDKSGRQIFIGEERATESQLANLKSEAEMIVSTNLWKLLHETPKELAQRALFMSGHTLDEMVKGRAILYTLATQETILNTFKSYAQLPPSKS